jgi:hypothetical protein
MILVHTFQVLSSRISWNPINPCVMPMSIHISRWWVLDGGGIVPFPSYLILMPVTLSHPLPKWWTRLAVDHYDILLKDAGVQQRKVLQNTTTNTYTTAGVEPKKGKLLYYQHDQQPKHLWQGSSIEKETVVVIYSNFQIIWAWSLLKERLRPLCWIRTPQD